MITQEERNFRLAICQISGYTTADLPLIWRFINGEDEALEEICAFRTWKKSLEATCFFQPIE